MLANETLSMDEEVVQHLSANADAMADVKGPLTARCILTATYLEKVTRTMKEMSLIRNRVWREGGRSTSVFNYTNMHHL